MEEIRGRVDEEREAGQVAKLMSMTLLELVT